MASGTATKSAAKSASKEAGGAPFERQFELFAKFGDTHSEGRSISLTNSDKWMKQSGVIGKGSAITTTDTSIEFKKISKSQKLINYQEYLTFLEALARFRKLDVADVKKKLTSCGPPATPGTTKISATGGVDRMTDATLYTGAHKERFDIASGKGKGIAGRKDVQDNTGYVSGFAKKDK